MYKLMHRVRAYTFDFCSFLSVAYTTLNRLFAVFFIYYMYIGATSPRQSVYNRSSYNDYVSRHADDCRATRQREGSETSGG